MTKRANPLHVAMHALADGGCAEDERGAALAVFDALIRAGFAVVDRGCVHEFDYECARCVTLDQFHPWRAADIGGNVHGDGAVEVGGILRPAPSPPPGETQ